VTGARPEPPPLGWRRRPWNAVPSVALDFEATGLDFARDTIISFGTVPIAGSRIDVGGSAYQLVDPVDVAMDPQAITIHGLRPMDLRGAPSLEAARVSLREGLGGRYLVTWFAEVEAAFLAKLFGGGPKAWLRRSVDVRRLVAALEGGEGGRLTLEGCAGRYAVPVASPHHALDDALVTAQLFLVIASKLAERGVWRIKDLQDATVARPPTLVRPRAPF
jgi:DNA polymerase-3 subunit epsilon